jgi:hypothetical protein
LQALNEATKRTFKRKREEKTPEDLQNELDDVDELPSAECADGPNPGKKQKQSTEPDKEPFKSSFLSAAKSFGLAIDSDSEQDIVDVCPGPKLCWKSLTEAFPISADTVCATYETNYHV